MARGRIGRVFLPILPLLFFSILAEGGETPLPTFVIRSSLFLLLLVHLCFVSRLPRGWPPLELPAGLFLLYSIASTAWAVYPWSAYQLTMNFTCVGAVYFLLRCDRAEGEGIAEPEWLMATVLAAGAIQALLAIYQSHWLQSGRPGGSFANPNFLAGYLFFGAAVSMHFWVRSSRTVFSPARIFFLASSGLMGYGIYLTRSRATVVVAAGLSLFLLLLVRGKRRYPYLAAAGAGTAVLLAAVAPRFSTVVDPYTMERINIWRAAWETAVAYPFGVGLGGYGFFWLRFRGPMENAAFRYWKTADTAHSQFFGILSELGFPGLFLALAVVVSLLCLVWRECHRQDRILPLCIIPLAAMIHAFFDDNLNVFAIALPVAACAALLANRNTRPDGKSISLSFVLRGGFASIALLGIGYSAATFLGYSYYQKGMDLLKRGETNLAYRDFSSARRFDPLCSTYPDAVSSVYFRWFLQTRRAEYLVSAVNAEQEAHVASPENPLHLSQVGFLLGKLAEAVSGEEDRRRYRAFALAALNDSLQKDPHGIIAQQRLVDIHRGAGEKAAERAVLERLIATEPNFVRAYLMLAGLEEEKNPGKAAEHYRKAIALSLAFENKPLEPGQRELLQVDRQGVRRRLNALEGRQISTNPEGR